MIVVIATAVTVTMKMMNTVRVNTDETKAINPREAVIFHAKITTTVMVVMLCYDCGDWKKR